MSVKFEACKGCNRSFSRRAYLQRCELDQFVSVNPPLARTAAVCLQSEVHTSVTSWRACKLLGKPTRKKVG